MHLTLRESICIATKLPRNDAIILRRGVLLAPEDRDLVDAVLIRGQSTRSVAGMMGKSARAVRTRVCRLGRMLTSRKFLSAARSMSYLSPADADLAKLYYCQGHSHRQLASRLGISIHVLRRRLDGIAAQIAVISKSRGGSLVPHEVG